MDWELVKPWVNRVGIVLEFTSFWFAAPEIVTEIRQDGGQWLRTLERRIEQWVRVFPATAWAVTTVAAALGTALLVLVLLGRVAAAVLAAVAVAGGLMAVVRYGEAAVEAAAGVMVSVMMLAMTVAVLKGAFRRGEGLVTSPWMWSVAVAAWGWALTFHFQDKLMRPLLRVLADDKRIRQRSLAVGAVLFVVGFLLQFIATF